MAVIDALFKKLIESRASDLHLEQGQKPKLRVHGDIQEIPGTHILGEKDIVHLLEEIVAKDRWANFENSGDLDFAYALGGEARFRANYFRHFNGLGAVFRLIPSKVQTLEELDVPKALKDFRNIRSGLVLVTGPTGSGKSTTLAALINDINLSSVKKIVTIEEPVEFMHENKKCMITHREVGLDTESFASGLKSAIKSDVNVVLVGELRDQETITMALTAAQMGILVFGTLHTNSAGKTIDRIIDVFPISKKNQIRTLLANTLQAVVAQQLLKSADGQRRWAAFEVLLKTTSLSAIIRTGETEKITTEIQTNRQKGMILLDEYLGRLVTEGKVSKDEAYMKAFDKAKFASMTQQKVYDI